MSKFQPGDKVIRNCESKWITANPFINNPNYVFLSQEEINQIIKEIQEEQQTAQNQLSFPNQIPYTPNPWYDTSGPKTQPSTPLKSCLHEMTKYTGLNEVFNYCKKCGEKEK